MRNVPLGAWLSILNLALALLVAGGLALAANSVFHRLALENARSRVELAAVAAQDRLERTAQETLTDARLLAERPTLLRLVSMGSRSELRSFLAQFRATSGSDSCAIVSRGEILADDPGGSERLGLEHTDWEGRRFLEVPGERGGFYVAASVPLANDAESAAVVARKLDPVVLRSAESAEDEISIRLEPARAALGSSGDGTDGSLRSRRVVADPSGAGIVIESSLPRAAVDLALTPLQARFAAVTAVASLIAVALGLVGARALSRPFRVLSDAARRIASGDLSSPVPRTSGAEGRALSSVMDDMRAKVLSVTTELRHREAEARALLEGIVEGVFAVDGERRIRYLNRQAAILLGREVEDVVGQFCGDVLCPVARDGVRPCDVACPIIHARSRGSSRAVEHLQLASGRRTIVITSAPPAGATQVQILRDETDIEAARRARDVVLANVSHELKTPLSGQLASIELLQDELSETGTPAARELAMSLQRSTIRLARLIDNLLESVRIETGRRSIRRQAVDLHSVVEEAHSTLLPLLLQRGQTVDVDLPASLPEVDGDPVQLTQVMVNLLANANRFAPDDSVIRVGAASGVEIMTIWVEDDGPGIPPGEERSVFDRFHRSVELSNGMGLGLWIVKSIVESHDGSVSVSSERTGARFTITLPARARR
ncbi:MAG TPA: ATP-binding protein [Planctomycetota bacterium]|nr:ATP-binding protein [Planctomycetota bacterium]